MKPKDVLLQFIEAFNHADVEALASLYDDNAVNHQVANEPVSVKPAIKQMFQDEFSAAKMVCIVKNIFEDGEWAIMEAAALEYAGRLWHVCHPRPRRGNLDTLQALQQNSCCRRR